MDCAAGTDPRARTDSGAPPAVVYGRPERPHIFSRLVASSRGRERESALIAVASFAISETTVVSRSSSAEGTRWGTGGSGSASPGTTIPPIAAGPVDGLSAVLPAASPAAEMPGFGLDTAAPPRCRATYGKHSCEPPPTVAFPRAHHLHVARPPVRVYEDAASSPQRIKRTSEKRNRRSGFARIHWPLQRASARRVGWPATPLRDGIGPGPGDTKRLTKELTAPHGNWALTRKLAIHLG